MGLIILFLAPIGLGYAASQAETIEIRQLLLVIAIMGLVLSAAYNLITERSLVEDVAPFLLIPYGIYRLIRFILIKTVRILLWIVSLGRFIVGRRDEHIPSEIVPRSWGELMSDDPTRRKLLSGRHAVLGYNDRRVVLTDLNADLHLLVEGNTGYGKTTVAWSIILSQLMSGPGSLDKMHFSIHDPKGVVGLHFEPLARAYPDRFQVYTRADASYAALDELVQEMVDRTHLLGRKRVLEVDQLDEPISHKLIVVDEPQLWFSKIKDYEDKVLQLVNAGRQAGFHVLMLIPYAKGTVVKTEYRVNFRLIASRLPRHATHHMDGMGGVTDLQRYEFLYQEDVTREPVYFRTYQITPRDIANVVAGAMYSPTTAEEIGVWLFVTMPNCGIRTFLREGVAHCQALVSAGRLKFVPEPWCDVKMDDGDFGVTEKAWKWPQEFFMRLEKVGIAGPAIVGKSREVLMSDVSDALAQWKVYSNGKKG